MAFIDKTLGAATVEGVIDYDEIRSKAAGEKLAPTSLGVAVGGGFIGESGVAYEVEGGDSNHWGGDLQIRLPSLFVQPVRSNLRGWLFECGLEIGVEDTSDIDDHERIFPLGDELSVYGEKVNGVGMPVWACGAIQMW